MVQPLVKITLSPGDEVPDFPKFESADNGQQGPKNREGFIGVSIGGQSTIVPFKTDSDGQFVRPEALKDICVYFGHVEPDLTCDVSVIEDDKDDKKKWQAVSDGLDTAASAVEGRRYGNLAATALSLTSTIFQKATEGPDQYHELDIVNAFVSDGKDSRPFREYLTKLVSDEVADDPTHENKEGKRKIYCVHPLNDFPHFVEDKPRKPEPIARRMWAILPGPKVNYEYKQLLTFEIEKVVHAPIDAARVTVVVTKCPILAKLPTKKNYKFSFTSSVSLLMRNSDGTGTSSTLPKEYQYSRNLVDAGNCNLRPVLFDEKVDENVQPIAVAISLKLIILKQEKAEVDEILTKIIETAEKVTSTVTEKAADSETTSTVFTYLTKAPESIQMLLDSRASKSETVINKSLIVELPTDGPVKVGKDDLEIEIKLYES